MRNRGWNGAPGWRRLGSAAVAALGIAAIVGSGGGAFLPDVTPDFDGPFAPSATIEPARVTVEAGATVTFAASAFGTPPLAYQWRRDGVDIAGATGTAYTLVGASPGDDGAQFAVVVGNGAGTAVATSLLRVSPWPGVVVEDGDFALADWAVGLVLAEPATGGPTYTASRAATGGNPGPFRVVTYALPAGPAAIRVFHTALSSTYDPAQQGAIYTIDFALDCNRLDTTTSGETQATPVLEQAGRWFAPQRWQALCAPVWLTAQQASHTADEFERVAGPACAAGQACPDFSAGAPPIRFGFIGGVAIPLGSPAGTVEQGIDNWRVTVWQR